MSNVASLLSSHPSSRFHLLSLYPEQLARFRMCSSVNRRKRRKSHTSVFLVGNLVSRHSASVNNPPFVPTPYASGGSEQAATTRFFIMMLRSGKRQPFEMFRLNPLGNTWARGKLESLAQRHVMARD